ncbi:MAG: reverse transcriptase family protein [Moritella sp.]|uniref:RNA-directed DNA polymerase n=1 Tax=Moritella sp. TaxID=78556 RepID=UPI001D972B8C|nr:reverse transcriptase family protein [Moritella sp.]
MVLQNDFLETINDLGLAWFVTDAITRCRMVDNQLQESTLDQLFTTNENIVNDFNTFAQLGKSDHVSFKAELNITARNVLEEQTKNVKLKWGSVTLDELLDYSFEVNWAYSSDKLTSESMFNELHGKLMGISKNIPVSNLNQPINSPWSSSVTKRNRKRKEKYWKIFDNDPTIEHFNTAMYYQESYESSALSAKIKFEKKITSNLKYSSRSFYSYLRSKRKIKSVVGQLRKSDGTKTTCNKEAASVLAHAFGSVFQEEPLGPLTKQCWTEPDSSNMEEFVSDINFKPADIKKELSHLNIYKSFGPDNVHPKLLKALAQNNQFVHAVFQLFENCVLAGSLPEIWKEANVSALFKKGDKSEPLNYRPVSLTCILCKVFEKLVRSNIVTFIEHKITKAQHGFIGGRSCLSNVLESMDTIIDILSEGAPVDVLYFDFCKAFDSVPHYRLLAKIERCGIKGHALNVIRDFLTGRRLRVSVGGEFSEYISVTSGVPQGSVLGPLLFILYINDLPGNINSICKLFADDLKLIVNASETDTVVADIQSLENWQNLWILKFNPTKCKVMHIDLNENANIDYYIDGCKLETVVEEKDLGVLTSNDLKWRECIKESISKANRMIGWITRNLLCREKSVMLTVYKSLIRPHLEYCVQVWSPIAEHGNWGIILEIESIQRKFTRLIDGIGTLTYSQRLKACNLTTLAERRIRGDLIETYKIVSGSVNYGSDIFKLSRSGLNIISKGSGFNFRKKFLPERVRNFWNVLPTQVKSSPSVDSFKIRLQDFKDSSSNRNESNFWEVSDILLDKIEKGSIESREKQTAYLKENPYVARKLGINISTNF